MSVDLKLTDEQAKWLRAHLDTVIINNQWKEPPVSGDETEHANTIRDKIKKVLEAGKW
jgi:hypothetical protein